MLMNRRYGYPKIDAPRVQLATFQPNSSVRTQIANRCIDLTLPDIEKAPTRFEQIHQALKQNTQRYTADLRPPERVCCILM
uniref:Aminotransferase n=1 Tax=Haemonchus contortus TaxID=6289 RepID=A0A7I5EA56_HAECO